MNRKTPKTTDGLMRHIRDNKGIQINGSTEKIQLRNIGYFHGFKGYNFFLNKEEELNFEKFSELHALYSFDTEIKSLFYKHVMFCETAIKNRLLEIVCVNSGFDLDSLFQKSLTYYKSYSPGSSKYKKHLKNTTRLRRDIYDMIHEHCNSKPYIYHYIHQDRTVPLYAVFELFTLGNLVFFTRCMSQNLNIEAQKQLKLYSPAFDQSKDILGDIIDCMKGLRNAIAHNGVLYDCRFKTGETSNRLKEYLAVKMDIHNLDFDRIIDYLILLILICSGLSYYKTELQRIIKQFEQNLDFLRSKISESTYDKIIGVRARPKLRSLKNFINNLDFYLKTD
ncbi:TPA: Abi family protein [Staphylococcus aureus]|nr:Abi family protein [Staphylococcus aureus]